MKYFKRFVLNNKRGWGMGIAIYELIGSLVILWLVYTNAHDLSFNTLFFLVPIAAIALTGLMAGILYFFKGNETRFYTLSKLNFCIQILQLALPGFTFIFTYGPYLAIGFDFEPNLYIRTVPLIAKFSLTIGQPEDQYVLVSIFPFIPLLALRWMERALVTPAEIENAFIENQQP